MTWAGAFTLALLKTKLYLFHGKEGGYGTLGSQEGKPCNFTSPIKFTMEALPPVRSQEILFLMTLQELVFH